MIKTGLLTLLITLLVLSSAWATDLKDEPGSKDEDKEIPVFKPGAEVTLAVKVQAPKHWVLNYMVPLRLSFDKEQMKKAPFSVKQLDWDFEFEEYVGEYMAIVPVKLQRNLQEGEVEIPLQVQCSICTETGDQCAFATEYFSVFVIVLDKAPKGQKTQPLEKGLMPAAVKLLPPE